MALGIALGGVAGAQSAEPACSVGFANAVSFGVDRWGSTPYVATAKTSFEQRLPDGSYVRNYAVTRQARDGAGRTRSEQPIACWRDEHGVPLLWLHVTASDPAAKTVLMWDVNNHASDKVAHVLHAAQSAPKRMTPEEQAARRKRAEAKQPGGEDKTEDLGMRTIAAVEAHGVRTTRTIPAGEEGNELALVTTHEMWIAKDPDVIVLAISDDPRRGRTTYEVEELAVGEPDAAMFAPPPGYKIVDPQAVADGAGKP